MKINCLSCGFKVDLDDDAYADYEGLAKCCTCSRMLEIRTVDGKLKFIQLVDGMKIKAGDHETVAVGAGAN